MSNFVNREKKQAFFFLFIIVIINMVSFENFNYPENIIKTKIDLTHNLNSSENEIRKTKIELGSYQSRQQVISETRTSVVDSKTPIRIKLKRAPAKVSRHKKSKIKSKKRVRKKHLLSH